MFGCLAFFVRLNFESAIARTSNPLSNTGRTRKFFFEFQLIRLFSFKVSNDLARKFKAERFSGFLSSVLIM